MSSSSAHQRSRRFARGFTGIALCVTTSAHAQEHPPVSGASPERNTGIESASPRRPRGAVLAELGAGFVGGVLGAGAGVLLAARPLCGSELEACSTGTRLAFLGAGYAAVSPLAVWGAGELTAGEGSLGWTYAAQGLGLSAAAGVVGLTLLATPRSGDLGYTGTGISALSWVLIAPSLLIASPVIGYEWSDTPPRPDTRSPKATTTIVPWINAGTRGVQVLGSF